MPGPRWRCTLIGLLAAAALLAAVAPALAQDDRSSARAALVPDELWTSDQTRASTLGSPPSDGGGWSIPLLLAALVVAYGAGLIAAHVRALPAAGPRPQPQAPPAPPPAVADARQECSIERSNGCFQVVTSDRSGRRRVVARTEAVAENGGADEVERRLAGRLRAVGWTPDPDDASRLARAAVRPGRRSRVAAIEARHSGDDAWFGAVALNSYASATPVAQSPTFHTAHAEAPERTIAAAAAHAALLADLEAAGWEASGSVGPWYATTLRRRPSARP